MAGVKACHLLWEKSMPLFEEINIDTTEKDGEIYINARQLAWHIIQGIKVFYDDSAIYSQSSPLTVNEAYYLNGIIEGMNSIVLLLSQGGVEEELNKKINTVEDLINTMKEKDE